MDQNVSKNIMAETVGGLINIGFSELAVIAGFPQASLAVPVVKGLVTGKGTLVSDLEVVQ